MVAEAGMQAHHRDFLDIVELGLGRSALLPGLGELGAKLREVAGALGDRVDDARNLAFSILQPSFQLFPLFRQLGRPLGELLGVALHESAHAGRVKHLVAQAAQHPLFKLAGREGARVGACLVGLVVGASPFLVIDQDPVATADRAGAHAAEQLLGSALVGGHDAVKLVVMLLHRVPLFVGDDPQFRMLLGEPLARRIGATDQLAAARLIDALRPVEDHDTAIKVVAEYPVGPAPVASECRYDPAPAGRTGHTFLVEPLADREGRHAGDELVIDPADDFGLLLVDRKEAADDFAVGSDRFQDPIAVGLAARVLAARMIAALPAPHLGRKLFEEARIHEALDRAGDVVDDAVAQGEEPAADMLDDLADRLKVAAMAGDAVGRFGQDLIDTALFDMLDEGIDARTLRRGDAGAPADLFIAIGADNLPAFPRATLAQQRQLILRGEIILQVRRISGVQYGLHHLPSRASSAQQYPSRPARRQAHQ